MLLVVSQACRGRRYDAGTELEDTVDSRDASQPTNVRRIPIEADVLLAYSVVPGNYHETSQSCDGLAPSAGRIQNMCTVLSSRLAMRLRRHCFWKECKRNVLLQLVDSSSQHT